MILTLWLNQNTFPVIDKVSETEVVAYTRFTGLCEIAKYIWKLRDWINANDLHSVGAPSCLMHIPAGAVLNPPEAVPCEVRWRVADAPHPTTNGFGLKLVEPQRILSTFHLGDTADIARSFHFLEQVIAAGGYHPSGGQCEVYLFDVSLPKSRWLTECQVFIEN